MKSLSIGTGIYLAIFLLDYIIELFQITQSGSKITLLGLKIETLMTKQSLNTNFSLTYRSVLSYILFISVWMILTYVLKKYKND